jgi:hypothetical protein
VVLVNPKNKNQKLKLIEIKKLNLIIYSIIYLYNLYTNKYK